MRKLTDFILKKGWIMFAIPLALSLSPVGLALAAGTIGSIDIINGAVKTVDLGRGAVTKTKLANNSVNSAKLANGSIVNADIAAGAAIAASKINSTSFVKNNTAADQTLAGKLKAPDFAYSSAKDGTLTISPIGSNIVGVWAIWGSAAVIATGPGDVDWYAPVYLPNGATITGLSHYAVTDAADQTTAYLYKWTDAIASVTSPGRGVNWGVDSTSTIAPGQATFDENSTYSVRVHMNGGHDVTLQSAWVKIGYTYTSPGN